MKKENISTFENGKRQKVENMQQMKMKNKRARGVGLIGKIPKKIVKESAKFCKHGGNFSTKHVEFGDVCKECISVLLSPTTHVYCVDLGERFHMSIYYLLILLAKIGFDTAENQPCKVCPLSV